MLALMERELGVDPAGALALASVVVDLRVTQVVNGRRRPRRAARRHVPVSERLRLLLERAQSGYRLRDAATGEIVRWEDPRIRA